MIRDNSTTTSTPSATTPKRFWGARRSPLRSPRHISGCRRSKPLLSHSRPHGQLTCSMQTHSISDGHSKASLVLHIRENRQYAVDRPSPVWERMSIRKSVPGNKVVSDDIYRFCNSISNKCVRYNEIQMSVFGKRTVRNTSDGLCCKDGRVTEGQA